METTIAKPSPIRCWIGNLARYADGELVGEWVNVDATTDWDALYERIHIPYDDDGVPLLETFCADWECDIPGLAYSEYPDYERLARIAEEWEAMDGDEQAVVSARMDALDEDFEEAVDRIDDTIVYRSCQDMEDVARELVDGSGMLDGAPDELAMYFDYEEYGRDLAIMGMYEYVPSIGCMVEFV